MIERNHSLSSRVFTAVVSAALILPALPPTAWAQNSSTTQISDQKLSEAEISSLVAPIALYPDPLVAQVLMASTYPLEVAEASNWQKSNAALKGEALNKALQDQTWDASVKSLVSFPAVLDMMGSQLSWTKKLGNAVLAQQKDVMNAVQGLRRQAQAAGHLPSNAQQTVTTEGSGNNTTVVIQPANPQVVYVPTYNPTVIYGSWAYPAYPPVAYYPPGYVAGTALLSFGVGMAVGAALWGGCHWGSSSITINNNNFNNFNRNTVRNWSNNSNTNVSNWRSDSNRVSQNRTGAASNARADAQREQLRQNLNKDGWMNSADQRRDSNNRPQSSGDRRAEASRLDTNRNAANDRPRADADRFGSFDRGSGFGNVDRAHFGGGENFGSRGGGGSFRGFRR
jgi:hypothetical protein